MTGKCLFLLHVYLNDMDVVVGTSQKTVWDQPENFFGDQPEDCFAGTFIAYDWQIPAPTLLFLTS